MIKGIAVILGTFLLFTLLVNNHAQKQEAGSEGIRTTIVVSRQSVLPYESLSVMVLVHNETVENKRLVASWCAFLSIGEITPAGINRWRSYVGDNEPVTIPCTPAPKNFAPGETKNMRAHIDYEAPSGEHVFAHPGKYVLQGAASDASGRFVSNEIKITVRKPEGIDAKAYEFLRTSDLHHFFGEYTIHKYKYDQKTVEDIEKFIANFDGSEYSYLARKGLAFMWLRGVEGKQDQSRAIELLSQVADHAGDPLSSEAEYYMAAALNRQQDIVKANYHFQRVLSGTPPPYFRYLAEESLRQH